MIAFGGSCLGLKSSHRLSDGSDSLRFERVDCVRTSTFAHPVNLQDPEWVKVRHLKNEKRYDLIEN
jgi:hypothetical protein